MGRSVYEFSYKERKKLRNTILFFVGLFFLVFGLNTLIFRFLLFPVVVKSNSMLPRVVDGSLILTSPIGTVNRGSTVVLKPEYKENIGGIGSFLNSFLAFITFQQVQAFQQGSKAVASGNLLRRVVGIPGDTIYMKDYILYIKPEGSSHFLTEFEVAEVSYDIDVSGLPEGWDNIMGAAGTMEEQVLEEGEYFLLCDNRTIGVDSRIWGPIQKNKFAGKALIQYFPFSGFCSL